MNKTQANKSSYHIISFYEFTALPQEQLLSLKQKLQDLTESLQIKGLILIGQEGINATIAGKDVAIAQIQSFLNRELKKDLFYKKSFSAFAPFKRMKVQVRQEIIKMKPLDLDKVEEDRTHLSPKAWHRAIKGKKGVFLDVRNWYETQIGTFSLAQVLDIQRFSEFAKAFKKLKIPKDQAIYSFCTGGIRCEKACVELKKMGYAQAYQLEGGILNYLQTYKDQKDNQWQGECFVFDHRVALTSSMKPSTRYALCPHCGQPAQQAFDCQQCEKSTKICDLCLEKGLPQTCSKNCTYHYNNTHKAKRGKVVPADNKL